MGKVKRKSSQSAPKSVTPLIAPILALQNLLTQFNDQGVIIGGIAASLLGTPRYTADLDAVLMLGLEEIPIILQAASTLGIEPRTADPIAYGHQYRILLLRHVASGLDINLSLGILPFENEMVERSTLYDIDEFQLRLPTPEDLIILKAVAHRSKDLADIQAVAANHPNLDTPRIRFWVEQFAEALEIPDLWDTISRLL